MSQEEKGLVRVTRSLNDKGILVTPDSVDSVVDDKNHDWYCSPFTYSEDALKYFNENNQSIKNYTGKVYTKTLFWDLDFKEDFEVVREAASLLLTKLDELGLVPGVEVFFSGNKGVHILCHTDEQFSPKETKEICKGIAEDAGIDLMHKVIDLTVYNANRIFRIVNTKHQESGLFKIPLSFDEIMNLSVTKIRTLAESTKPLESFTVVKPKNLKTKYIKAPAKSNLVRLPTFTDADSSDDFQLDRLPRNKRRCIHMLEQGMIEPGERENATIRLCAHYRSQGVDREQAFSLIQLALSRREEKLGTQNPYSESDINRNLDQVYSESWRGGTYTCKSDDFLASKCSVDGVPCAREHVDPVPNIINVEQFCEQYVKYTAESQKDFPKTGLEWLDAKVRIRPRNFSIVNGANGSGKTSIVLQILEQFNIQKIYNIMFSLDMADSSLFEKLGARYTDYSPKEIEDAFINKETAIMEKVQKAIKKHFPYTFFDFTSLASSSYIEKVIRQVNGFLAKQDIGQKLDVAIIDYAGRVSGEENNAYANATANALAANDIAKRQNLHLMYISQISRENGDHTTPLRTSRVSKDSGAWEENATFILNCWRPFGDGLMDCDNYFHIYISKNRGGGLGEHAYWWEGARGDITEMSEPEYEDYVRLCLESNKPAPPSRFVSLGKMDPKRREKLFGKDRFVTEEEDKKNDSAKSTTSSKKISNTRDR